VNTFERAQTTHFGLLGQIALTNTGMPNMSLVGIHRDSKNMNCFLRKLFWNGRRALLESITTEIEQLYSVTRVVEHSPPLWEFEILKNMAQYLRFPLQADPSQILNLNHLLVSLMSISISDQDRVNPAGCEAIWHV